jgi:hypothetical protein
MEIRVKLIKEKKLFLAIPTELKFKNLFSILLEEAIMNIFHHQFPTQK